MHETRNPVFTSTLDDVSMLRIPDGSLYIAGVSIEDRSQHTESWEESCTDVTFARLKDEEESSMTLVIKDVSQRIQLRSRSSMSRFLSSCQFDAIYLDITGLPHHVWAPLLRSIRERDEPAYCVYVEPNNYQFSATPTENTIFDLSERIGGIAPLPGFASFFADVDGESLFVPLLGFEGTRFAYALEAVQPKREDIIPVIGVPGFRPEYPFHTYIGNRQNLWETRAWKNVRYATANCPFSIYNLLVELFEEDPSRRMIIAPIGTKPHALGAVLYCLDNPANTEILYDHPVRKAKRTQGTSRVCLYDLSRMPRPSNFQIPG